MKRKIVVLIISVSIISLLTGCTVRSDAGNKEAQTNTEVAEASATEAAATDSSTEAFEVSTEASEAKKEAVDSTATSDESIQEEMAGIEAKSQEYENFGWENMAQQDINSLSSEWYQLWDDELNSLWSRLSDQLDSTKMDTIKTEEKEWISTKDASVEAAGAEAAGGSLQPQLENLKAKELTRARAYVLAGYLAEALGEDFTISDEIQKSIDAASPTLETVFEKFEGMWATDFEETSYLGIERTLNCAYAKDQGDWTVWVTDGIVLSDLDVCSYTDETITFQDSESKTYYLLTFNMAGGIELDSGSDLNNLEQLVVTIS